LLKPVKITLIVTTYNWPEALELVLIGLNHQSAADFEVIVADDGSTPQTSALINAYLTRVNFPLSHIWQEDAGFRASKIRNKAAAQAKGDYLVFLDGDCIPLISFIQRHLQLMEEGWMVSGNRILLNASITK
jgi:glycosyltransferase involved in cell wall biosynthesis